MSNYNYAMIHVEWWGNETGKTVLDRAWGACWEYASVLHVYTPDVLDVNPTDYGCEVDLFFSVEVDDFDAYEQAIALIREAGYRVKTGLYLGDREDVAYGDLERVWDVWDEMYPVTD